MTRAMHLRWASQVAAVQHGGNGQTDAESQGKTAGAAQPATPATVQVAAVDVQSH